MARGSGTPPGSRASRSGPRAGARERSGRASVSRSGEPSRASTSCDMPAGLSSSGAGTRRGAIPATGRIAAANARRRLLTDGDLAAHATTPRRAVVEALDLHRRHAVVAAVRRLDAVDEALRLIAHRPV